MNLQEHGPNEPVIVPIPIQQAAYRNCLEALVLVDVADLRSAATTIQSTGNLHARTIQSDVLTIEKHVLDNNREKVSEMVEYTLEDTIRSYVYSGLEVDDRLVKFAAAICGFDNKRLKRAAWPGSTILKDVLGVKDRKERRRLRRMGMAALDSLDLLPRFTKTFTRIDCLLT